MFNKTISQWNIWRQLFKLSSLLQPDEIRLIVDVIHVVYSHADVAVKEEGTLNEPPINICKQTPN